MNKIIAMFVVLFVAGQSMADTGYVGTFGCKATTLRTDIQGMSLDGYLEFMVYQKDGVITLGNVLGHIKVDRYYGVFSFEKISNNPKYKPTKYKDYVQFQDFDAIRTSSQDGMWGQLVINKELKKEGMTAHYIFQASDHMGGTIDLTCRDTFDF
jgi:hypothetical protein